MRHLSKWRETHPAPAWDNDAYTESLTAYSNDGYHPLIALIMAHEDGTDRRHRPIAV